MYHKYVGFALTLIAFGLFIPGILLPMFNLSMDMNVAVTGTDIKSSLVNKELSIINTVKELWHQNRYLVSILIFVFSILIPAMKTSALTFVFFAKSQVIRKQVAHLIAAIGKWSMADVFVVAILVAFFTAQATAELQSHLHEGFYWFTGYCLVSIFSGQCLASYSSQQQAAK